MPKAINVANAEEREVRLELLIGCMVVDMHGKHVGRIEEVVAEVDDGGCHVQEFHLGPSALRERIAATLSSTFLLKRSTGRMIVPWRELDLSDPRVPVWTGRR